MNKYATKLVALALSVSLLSGCTLLHFDDPEEARADQETLNNTAAQQEAVDYAALLDSEHLQLDDLYKDDTGAVLARYRVSLPWFGESEDQAVQNINAHYEEELAALKEDEESLFALAAEMPSAVVRESVVEYQLLDAPEGYVCALGTLNGVDTLGRSPTVWFGDVFSASTGWLLRFDDLVEDRGAAMESLTEAAKDWCARHGCGDEWLADFLPGEELTFDRETVWIGLPAGTAPNGETVMELPFGVLEPYLK